MNILISITSLETGGAQIFAQHLATELQKRHSVVVYELGMPPQLGKTIHDRFPANIPVLSFNMPERMNQSVSRLESGFRKVGIRSDLAGRLHKRHFLEILRKHKIDIVHTHLFHSDLFVTSA